MNPQEIKDFLKSIKGTDIEELAYQNGADSFYFKKGALDEEALPVAAETAAAEIPAEEKSTLVSIKSIMVGTFMSAPNNDKPPFVKEGSSVDKGQRVGQIEAMKITKDVTSGVKGKIVKVLVSNGQSVEYGQELFVVDTK